MRFTRISIRNFRQYHEIDFSFDRKKPCDLHVIIGQNGLGKTNLFNAIRWCLYDEESTDENNEGLPICNIIALDDARNRGEKSVNVTVTIYAEDGGTQVVFERSARVGTNSPELVRGELKVTKTPPAGNSEIFKDYDASAIVNSYLPKKISQYFFFDGEQLKSYFDEGTRSTTHIKDSIYEITQINAVSGVKKDLNEQLKNKIHEISGKNPQTSKYQDELDGYIQDRQKLVEDIGQLEQQSAEAKDTIADLTRKIAGQEQVTEANEEYERTQDEIKETKKKKDALRTELEDIIRRYTVYLMLYRTNKETRDFIDDKEKKGSLPPSIDISLLKDSISEHRCAVCGQRTTEDIEQRFNDLLKKIELSTGVSNRLMEIKNDVSRAVDRAGSYRGDRDALKDEMYRLDQKIIALEEKRDSLYNIIKTCSSIDDISSWMEERDSLEKLRENNLITIASYKNKCDELDKMIEQKQAQIETATKADAEVNRLKKQVAYLDKAIRVVGKIEQDIISSIRTKMEQDAFELFSNLIWKKNTYDHIELDSNFAVRLFHVHGDSCLGSCGAAERQMLALAFTIALHKVAHYDNLLFIDTPAGRVSDINRELFAKALITASRDRQLILLFTPSEYSDEISGQFGTAASTTTRLRTVNEKETFI